jgi:hypothetical protein
MFAAIGVDTIKKRISIYHKKGRSLAGSSFLGDISPGCGRVRLWWAAKVDLHR